MELITRCGVFVVQKTNSSLGETSPSLHSVSKLVFTPRMALMECIHGHNMGVQDDSRTIETLSCEAINNSADKTAHLYCIYVAVGVESQGR